VRVVNDVESVAVTDSPIDTDTLSTLSAVNTLLLTWHW